ncbi:hypothetical protein [Streptomyces cinereoruber]|uniref:hypothetical protein n=1 Tax=Streptomyces cinereoruber TaxID=67260 RepID=UPI003643980A
MGRLASTVHVYDPERRERVILLPGDEPSPAVARLITAPAAWEDEVLPEIPDDEPGPEPDPEVETEPDPADGPEPEAEAEPEPVAAEKPPAPRRTGRKAQA